MSENPRKRGLKDRTLQLLQPVNQERKHHQVRKVRGEILITMTKVMLERFGD